MNFAPKQHLLEGRILVHICVKIPCTTQLSTEFGGNEKVRFIGDNKLQGSSTRKDNDHVGRLCGSIIKVKASIVDQVHLIAH